jgi:hypothetical protein
MVQAGSRTPKPIIMTSQHSANVFTADFSCDNKHVYSGGKKKINYIDLTDSIDYIYRR